MWWVVRVACLCFEIHPVEQVRILLRTLIQALGCFLIVGSGATNKCFSICSHTSKAPSKVNRNMVEACGKLGDMIMLSVAVHGAESAAESFLIGQ